MRTWLTALRSPLWVSRIVFVVGAVSLLSAYLPGIAARTRLVNQVVPDSFPAAATTGGAAIGVVLIVLSRGLRRSKARAWTVALLLTSLAATRGTARSAPRRWPRHRSWPLPGTSRARPG